MTPPATPPEASIAELARAIIEENSIELPPLPELAMRLRKMLSDENVETKQVAMLISTDPAITSTLLRRANSAAFGGLRAITDIAQAVARLGLKQVESLVTTLALKGTFDVGDPNNHQLLRELWNHSLMVALGAKRIAVRSGLDPESVFLAGLLHDVGRLVVLKGVNDLQQAGQPEVTPPVLDELMETLHSEFGHRTLKAWKLPDDLCRVARDHEVETEDATDLLLLAVQAADSISCKLGFHPVPNPDLALLDEPAIELLNIGDIELATLMVDLEDDFDSMQSLL